MRDEDAAIGREHKVTDKRKVPFQNGDLAASRQVEQFKHPVLSSDSQRFGIGRNRDSPDRAGLRRQYLNFVRIEIPEMNTAIRTDQAERV